MSFRLASPLVTPRPPPASIRSRTPSSSLHLLFPPLLAYTLHSLPCHPTLSTPSPANLHSSLSPLPAYTRHFLPCQPTLFTSSPARIYSPLRFLPTSTLHLPLCTPVYPLPCQSPIYIFPRPSLHTPPF